MTATTESSLNERQKDDARSAVEDAKGALEDGIADARSAVDEFARDAGKEVRKATDQATAFIKDNPGMALVGAVGLGILVGLAMRSR